MSVIIEFNGGPLNGQEKTMAQPPKTIQVALDGQHRPTFQEPVEGYPVAIYRHHGTKTIHGQPTTIYCFHGVRCDRDRAPDGGSHPPFSVALNELRPCPQCGQIPSPHIYSPRQSASSSPPFARISCDNCGLEGPMIKGQRSREQVAAYDRQLVEQWNRWVQAEGDAGNEKSDS